MFCRKCGAENPDDSVFCQKCGTQYSQIEGSIAGLQNQLLNEEELLKHSLADKYSDIRKTGAGGMASVYLATENSLERLVAIKVLPQAFLSQEDFVTRFLREAKISAKLTHPNIVTIHSINQDPGLIYFVMDFLPNGSLSDRIKKRGRLSTGEIIRWGDDICSGLAYAHTKGVVHRDLKPGNIMFDEHDNAVIMDFGIARATEGTNLTTTGSVIGTPSYMSPEAAKGEVIDLRGDIYSLGIILYQMATGTVPFKASSPASLMYMHVHEKPEPPSKCEESVPVWLNDIILRCLEKNPHDRYQTAKELAIELERHVKESEIDYTPLPVDISEFISLSDPSISKEMTPPQKRTPVNNSQELSPAASDSEARIKAIKTEPQQQHATDKSKPIDTAPPVLKQKEPPAEEHTSVSSMDFSVDDLTVTHKTPKRTLGIAALVISALAVIVIIMRFTGGSETDQVWTWIVEPQFERAMPYEKTGLARIVNNGKYGFVDRSGALVILCMFDDAQPFTAATTPVKQSGKWGLIDQTGAFVLDPIYDIILPFSNEIAPCQLKGKWGYIDQSGAQVAQPKFDEVSTEISEPIPVRIGGKWGYWDRFARDGKLVITARYEEAFPFHDGLAPVRDNSGWHFINTQGDKVIKGGFDWIAGFSDGKARILMRGKWGFVDRKGNLAVEPAFDEARDFHEGLAPVRSGELWGYINASGEVIVPPEYDNAWEFEDGLATVSKNGCWGFIDVTGNEVIPAEYDNVMDFHGSLAPVQQDIFWGYIDRNGNTVIEPQFEEALPFSDGPAPVKSGGKWGYIEIVKNDS